MGTALRIAVVLAALSAAGCGSSHTVKPFAGDWIGHTRELKIAADGTGTELVDDGCCQTVLRMRLRVTHVRGATASYVVVSGSHRGERGTLALRHGVVTDQLTQQTFCGPGVGRCGA